MNRWLRFACVLTLIALVLMVWSLFDRTLIPIIVAMTVAQALGTAAFAAYGYVVFRDLTARHTRVGDADDAGGGGRGAPDVPAPGAPR
ncbi:MAG TPA: hypothetical protein VFT22_07885 [Kofleriaceae bacterium]|nr:hypothetical protein [Kofleriaceae bacterium]